MMLRPELSSDIDIIGKLTRAAFKDMPFSNQTEAAIIDALRNEDALFLSLVAIENEKIIGHIAFSPVSINDNQDGWYGLGPVSVWPELQGKGIGQALIIEGLQRLKDQGAKGCVLLGSPDYYKRFDFVCDPDLRFEGAPAEYFQRLVFVPPAPKGVVRYHAAFGAS